MRDRRNNGGALRFGVLAGVCVLLAVPVGAAGAGSIYGGLIKDGTVTTNELKDLGVFGTDLAPSAVTSTKIKDYSIDAIDLKAGSVTSSKIGSSAVGTTHIAGGAVGSAQVAGNAISSSHIAAGAVGVSDIAQSVWSTGAHAAGLLLARPAAAAGNAGYLYFAADENGGTMYRSSGAAWIKVARGATESAEPTGAAGGDLDGTYPNPSIADDAVDASAVADNAIGNSELDDDAVDSAEIAGNAVGNSELDDDAVGSAELADDAVGNSEVADDAVGAAELADDAVGADALADGAVEFVALAQSAITGVHPVGTLAARPAAAAGNDGMLYLATDDNSGTLYRSNGTTWIKAGRGATEAAEPTGTAGGDLDGTYPNPTIADDAIDANTIADDAVGNSELDDDAVDSAEIADNAIGNSELGDDVVGTAELADDSVGAAAIADGAVEFVALAQSAITGIHPVGTLAARPAAAAGNDGMLYLATDDNSGTLYRSNGTTWVKAGRGATEAAEPTGTAGGDLDGTYPNPTIAGDAIDSAKIADDAIGNSELGDDVVGTAEIADDAVGAAALADDAVGADALADGAVGFVALAQSAFTGVHPVGTLAARPAAAAGNDGMLYLATDDNGGTLYRSNGTTWVKAGRGATESIDASGTAGGDLDGTYPNPTIATDAVDAAEIASGAVGADEIDDGSIGNDDIGIGALIAFAKLAAPIADFSFNNQNITDLANPVAAQDAATKAYVDAYSSSFTNITSDVVNNNGTANTLADITGLSFSVTSGNRYWFRFVIPYTAAATTTGSRWTISAPAASLLTYTSDYPTSATARTINNLVAVNLPAASNASSAATTGNIAMIEGMIVPSANGTVQARFASEVASSAITAKAGAFVEYRRMP